MLIDKNPVERYKSVLETQKIDWDSFQFKIDALDDTKVNMIIDFFNVISESDLNIICIKYLTDKRVVSERSQLWLHKGPGW